MEPPPPPDSPRARRQARNTQSSPDGGGSPSPAPPTQPEHSSNTPNEHSPQEKKPRKRRRRNNTGPAKSNPDAQNVASNKGSSHNLDALRQKLKDVAGADRARLSRRLKGVERARKANKPVGKALQSITKDIDRSTQRRARKLQAVPKVSYPPDLPVSAKRDEIAAAIQNHQVVVVCGETGSGKTTQLPKICVELGRGIEGVIGHTQPRRLAARSVASRIAKELHVKLGEQVGHKVRFTDQTSDHTFIKLMTDGVLLAESQGDRLLEQYDTIIIDEAHERSLNIDFLLGYLRNILPKRPDLKVIITSATIDPERFQEHFAPVVQRIDGKEPVPIINVSGRTYPVDVRYRPLVAHKPAAADDGYDSDSETEIEEVELIDGVIDALEEARREDATGHVLVFMPGEREIRDTADAVREFAERAKQHVDVMPLYARLSPDEQDRIFAPSKRRRVVIATNVAETSLTVPGIKFVIDPGLARISRYSARSKVQRLPIEAVSQASAKQRAGRCGRIGPGICFRLYSQEDHDARPEFTDPEILRTNLANVILQMRALRLGDVADFPFVEKPDRRQIRDGIDTLRELGALDEEENLTDTGRELARLPVDPRIGRMIIAGAHTNCLHDVLVIAAGLSVQDPRLRPTDKQHDADASHERFRDPESDFLASLNVWNWFKKERKGKSRRQLMNTCVEAYVSFLRMREWEDVHAQLRELCDELGYKTEKKQGPNKPADSAAVHKALLSGLLSSVGHKKNNFEYAAPHGVVYSIFPGSGLFGDKPAWLMASEIVRTTRVYARTVAKIDPRWIEHVGSHLISKRYSDARWDERLGKVLAHEHITLYGLPIHTHPRADYSHVNEVECRELFIHHALVEGEYGGEPAFLAHNRQMIEHVQAMEAKARQRDILVDAHTRYNYYDQRIPSKCVNRETFEQWLRNEEKVDPTILRMAEEDLVEPEAQSVEAQLYPDTFSVGETKIPLSYEHKPGSKDDGVTMTLPLEALPTVDAQASEWLVPGMRSEKVEALLKTLPKAIRRQFVPLSGYAAKVAQALAGKEVRGSFRDAVRHELEKIAGVPIPKASFRKEELPEHLRMNFRVVSPKGDTLSEGRDLPTIRQELSDEIHKRLHDVADAAYRRDNITSWDFAQLPESVEFERNGTTLTGYPTLVDRGDSVSLRLLGAKVLAEHATIRGLRRLLLFEVGEEVTYQIEHLPGRDRLVMHAATLPQAATKNDKHNSKQASSSSKDIFDQVAALAVEFAFLRGRELIRTQAQWSACVEQGWHKVGQASLEAADLVTKLLAERHSLTLELEQHETRAAQSSGQVGELYVQMVADVKSQAKALCPPRFLVTTPSEWLKHMPRYLRSARLRMKKFTREGALKDAQSLGEIRRFEQMYNAKLRDPAISGVPTPELIRFRWMIEELRVSYFAQELGTSMTVSPKRLMKQWDTVEREPKG